MIDDGDATLYSRPSSGRDSDEFFRDRLYGELWVGRRPSLREVSDSLGLRVRHPTARGRALSNRQDPGLRRSSAVDAMVAADESLDEDFARVVSEARLVKDAWEVAELQQACDTTTLGFEDVVRDWENALRYGERWIEGTFFRRARAMGNDIGYDSIVGGGRHATTLHWIENTGTINPGELVLLDMGAEGNNLYTADVTRTPPIDGRFTTVQRELYDLVHAAQQAGIDAVRPGMPFLAAHEAASSPGPWARRPWPVAGLGRRGARPDVQGLRALDPARHQPHARHGRPRLRVSVSRDLPARRPRRGHVPHGRAGALLPGRRPARPRGAPRHRHPDRGRRPGHRRRRRDNLSAALPRTSAEVEEWMGNLL